MKIKVHKCTSAVDCKCTGTYSFKSSRTYDPTTRSPGTLHISNKHLLLTILILSINFSMIKRERERDESIPRLSDDVGSRVHPTHMGKKCKDE